MFTKYYFSKVQVCTSYKKYSSLQTLNTFGELKQDLRRLEPDHLQKYSGQGVEMKGAYAAEARRIRRRFFVTRDVAKNQYFLFTMFNNYFEVI